MLTGGQFYDVVCAVVPLYVALFLGYASLKWWGVVSPEQSAGVSRVNALVAMPPLIFQIIAFNDPYTMNNRLIAAYCLANGIVLGALTVWAWFARSGSLEWVITLFQMAVMPNTIIVGIPVLSPLYAITGSGIAAVFIGQVLWLFPVLFLYELRAVKKLQQQQQESCQHSQQPPTVIIPPPGAVPLSVNGPSEEDRRDNGIPALMTQAERDDSCRIKIGEQQSAIKEGEPMQQSAIKEGDPMSNGNSQRDVELHAEEMMNGSRDHNDPHDVKMDLKEMAIRVGTKMVKMPLTYSTLLGIIYSLIAGRWHFGPPQILRTSLDIIGRITLGLTMYSIGLFMAGQKKLVTSWWVAFYGAFCRFLIGPGAMALASLVLGLRGDTLRFAILQAALPQAVISFVFAKDYDLHTSVFTTAVSLQTIVFMPIVLAYYFLLEI